MRYRGLPTVYDYVEHEQQVGGTLSEEDWSELHRELQQYNYRRLALSSLAEETLRDGDTEQGEAYLNRTLRDIDRCLSILDRLEGNGAEWDGPLAILVPTLVFNRARLLTRLRIAQRNYDEAVEQAEQGIRDLSQALNDAGFESDQCEQNPAIAYLDQMSRRLRDQHGITLTLQERLDEAIEQEDFEAAARLRDELSQRRKKEVRPQLPFSEDL